MGWGLFSTALFFSIQNENYILDFKYVCANDEKARIKTMISRSVAIILKTFPNPPCKRLPEWNYFKSSLQIISLPEWKPPSYRLKNQKEKSHAGHRRTQFAVQ